MKKMRNQKYYGCYVYGEKSRRDFSFIVLDMKDSTNSKRIKYEVVVVKIIIDHLFHMPKSKIAYRYFQYHGKNAVFSLGLHGCGCSVLQTQTFADILQSCSRTLFL